jgi:APA family basic amino acid/polyamine antiporter
MAADGLFFKRLAEVHPRFGTPAISIAACTIWSAILALSGTFEQLFTYVVFIGWIFYGLSAFTLFIYRTRQPDLARPYRVPGYPLTPVLFIVAVAALVANNIVAQPVDSAKGLAVVFIGAPIYLVWRWRVNRAAPGETTPQ